ncbi:MAG: ATP-dependent RecD-like DNA helicase [Eubacteriales bacterium]
MMEVENLQNNQQEEQTLSGVVEHVVYQNNDTGYAVFRMRVDGENPVVVVGNIPYVGVGESITVWGVWISHPSYGEQFKASSSERTMPADEGSILEYLSSGAVRGVGPVTAKRIFERFGTQTFDVLSSQPELLSEIQGITLKKARVICESFSRQLGIRRLMEYLFQYGIPPYVSIKLYKWYGNMALDFLRDNPYLLTDERLGVGFGHADLIASELGISPDSPIRVEAAVIYVLEHNIGNGHVYIPAEKLISATARLLSVEEPLCSEALQRLVDMGRIVREWIAEKDACYLARLYDAETEIAHRLMLMTGIPPQSISGIERLIDDISVGLGVKYAPLQLEAIRTAAEHSVMLLTGGPGTGKSTSIRGMLKVFDHLGLKTVLCSPTGRAAKRLAELTGREASTIHRVLEVSFSPDETGFQFVHDEDEPIDADAVILDEMSMVDVDLMNALLKAIRPGAKLVMVGDPDQLPSVGPGNILKDLLDSDRIATVRLTEIFRQAEESNIVTGAHAVNQGKVPELKHKTGDFFFIRRGRPQNVVDTVVELCTERLPNNMGLTTDQIQVLSPTRRGIVGTENLNLALQQALNPPAANKAEIKSGQYLFRTGDRVMHIRNNYDLPWQSVDGKDHGIGVFNGDVGNVYEIDKRAENMVVRYEDRIVFYPFELLNELEPAYAMTVHKSQGSEYPAVVFVASQAAPQLLNRAVFYTAITRAQKLLVIVGEEEVVVRMVNNNRRSKRYSGLKYRLM